MNYPVKIENVSFSYDEKLVLEQINLQIKRGQFVSIIGPNGSGKSTLLKLIAKQLPSAARHIYLDGVDIRQYTYKQLAQKLALLAQQNSFEYGFSAFDAVMMGRYPHLGQFESEGAEDIALVREVMKQTDIWQFRDRPVNTLSGGERQRVVLARAMVQDAAIMLLDEPITYLDIHHQIDSMKRIKAHAKKAGKTVIAVLHDLNFALKFSDQLILLSEGRLLSAGLPGAVLSKDHIKQAYQIDVKLIKKAGELDYVQAIIDE